MLISSRKINENKYVRDHIKKLGITKTAKCHLKKHKLNPYGIKVHDNGKESINYF